MPVKAKPLKRTLRMMSNANRNIMVAELVEGVSDLMRL